MPDKSLKKECAGYIRRFRRVRSGPVYDNAYYLIPRLKEAKRCFCRGGDARFTGELYKRLSLMSFCADTDGLCVFLRRYGASDKVIRDLRCYLTLIYCRRLSEGHDVTAQLRATDRLDMKKIVRDCSPLERRLLLCRDYAESDEQSKERYRENLRRYARRRRCSPQVALTSIPSHKLSPILFGKSGHGPLYAVLLCGTFIFLLSLIALITGSFAAALVSALPLYRLACFFAGIMICRAVAPRAPLRLDEHTELPPCLTVITSVLDGGASKLCRDLEQMYYTEGDGMLLGILADLPDCKKKYSEKDEKAVLEIAEKIEELNEKHGGVFYLFVRQRRYSVSEDAFIAPDRKRGAVCELIRQLYTGKSSLQITGDEKKLRGIPYVITLDSDTLLYPGSSASLLRCAAHPVNRAVIDREKRVVIKGHGIFQPGVRAKLKNGADTLFSRIYAADSGIEQYHGAGGNVYDAAFGIGSFCGKGLIDVGAFYHCCVDVFPDGRILSHDALEGARLRCLAVTDVVMYENTPKNALSYFKRLDRWIRGDIQSLPFAGAHFRAKNGERIRNGLSAAGRFILINSVLYELAPVFSVLCAVYGLITGMLPVMSVIGLCYLIVPALFSLVLHSHSRESAAACILYALFQTAFIFKEAETALLAALRAAVSMITHKRLLRWTTASAADGEKNGAPGFIRAFLSSFVFGVLTIFFSSGASVLLGALTAVSPFIAYRPSFAEKKQPLRDADRDFLISAVSDHMKYFDRFVTAEHNHLPPDNYQFFGGVGVAARTSPTNIGLYLLCLAGAADLGLSGTDELYEKLYNTLKTLCRLPKKDGLLYNWYNTRTASIISDFVSTVDCGNYLCSLITLRSALREYEKRDGRFSSLIAVTDGLIDECRLDSLYDGDSGLFFIGSGRGADNKYDLYESEMHTTDVAAIAYGFAPASHLSALSRPVVGSGDRRGIASWSGTAFEYFMPALFLPAPDGSICRAALHHAAREQKKDSVTFCGMKIYGKSESCYFGFDSDMDYQYKAHGVRSLSLCAGPKENVISPYSLFLMQSCDRNAEKVLKHLKANGLYGEFGFYEAVDLDPGRVGGGYAVIKCVMAHHIGMSVIASVNRLCGGIFVKRFCSDTRIASVLPLLYERFPPSRPVKFRCRVPDERPARPDAEGYTADCALITNTVCTVCADKYGAGIYRRGTCVCDHRAQGPRGLSLLVNGSSVFDLMRYPVSFSDGGVEYEHDGCRAVLSVGADSASVILGVKCGGDGAALCFEPILSELSAHERHAAYSSLFIVSERDGGVIRFIRRGKNALCISAAAYTDGGTMLPVSAYYRADELHSFTSDSALFRAPGGKGPGACVFPQLFIKAKAPSISFVIGTGKDKNESDEQLYKAASARVKAAPVLPYGGDPVFYKLLSCVMRPAPKPASFRYGLPFPSVLYKYGISGDRPIVLLDCSGSDGVRQIRSVFPSYARAAVRFLAAGIGVDFVITYEDDGYYNKNKNELYRMTGSCGLSALIGERIFIVCAGGDERQALSDLCVYRISGPDKSGSAPYIPEDAEYEKKRTALPAPPRFEDGAAIVPSGATYSPMCFIYANPSFGTLVTDRSGGYTWYGNARMFTLTRNDTSSSGRHEKILFKIKDKTYELFSHCGECRFYTSYAQWRGGAGGAPYSVKVAVDPKTPYKTVTVECDAEGEICYLSEPVMGETYVNGTLRFAFSADTAFISNAYGKNAPSMFVYCENFAASFDGRYLSVKRVHAKKTVFVIGAASSHTFTDLAVRGADGVSERYARRIKDYLSAFTLRSPDRSLDLLFNVYSRYQALICRQFARLGPSQTGGAYGFRDQLQDCLCTVYGDPLYVRAHILRCAAHQYGEGDVMHWFHPVTEKGVRSRCSDDMLWLPYVVYDYIRLTSDRGILDTEIRCLCSEPLCENERERYEKACPSQRKGTLLEHCKKAAGRIATGAHGLCLMGGGDWNDGMNEVGKGGGESVWLCWFLRSTLLKLAP
ncbi:MAG: hypothetical protein J5879_07090, partial [Clostridia bacterium]|nr:hypothetical protein [Clostridia bacterium]